MTNIPGNQVPAKRQKMLKKFENSSMKTIPEQSMSSQTPLRSVMEFARRSEQKILKCDTLLLHHDNAPTHTSLKTSEFVTNNNMVIISHPLYSPDLATVVLLCFPN
jgi:hypothetical protein